MEPFNVFANWRITAKVFAVLLFLLVLVGCVPAAGPLPTGTGTAPSRRVTDGPNTATVPSGTATKSPATAARVLATATVKEPIPEQEAAVLTSSETPEAVTYPLAESGPYAVGKSAYEFVDESRNGRRVSIGIWYPAQFTPDAAAGEAVNDAPPDMSGAPYPLLLGSSLTGGDFGSHMASHGFVMVGIRGMNATNSWGKWLIDYPRDFLFVLEQVATEPIPGLEGLIDANHAGAMGYSFDGYDALSLSGARIDPEFYLGHCADPAGDGQAPEKWWVEYICAPAEDWENFAANAGEAITTSEDGLWQAMTDERIRAVMPLAPEGAWLFGERGLAEVDRPTLIIGATKDLGNFYYLEAAPIYEQLGTPDRFLVSFIDQGHTMIFNDRQKEKMAHFATAFFGTYLQERSDLAPYFQEEFVVQHDELAWGVYEAE